MSWLGILALLGWPDIYLLSPEQFAHVTGKKPLGTEWAGDSDDKRRIITVHPGMRGKQRTNTLWHETAHVLWPWREHWWIYLFGCRMAGGGGDGGEKWKKGHELAEMPCRARLLELARRQSERLKRGGGSLRRKPGGCS